MRGDQLASRSTNRTLAAALTRGDRSTIGRWFWTIDKTLLIIIFALVAAGIVAVAAASPAAARRLSGTALRFDDLYFLYRQLGWVALGLPLMLATSMLDMRLLKRLAVIGTLGCLVALLLEDRDEAADLLLNGLGLGDGRLCWRNGGSHWGRGSWSSSGSLWLRRLLGDLLDGLDDDIRLLGNFLDGWGGGGLAHCTSTGGSIRHD